MKNDIQDIRTWLNYTHHFNRQWHDCEKFLRQTETLTDVEEYYFKSKCKMLLQQKNNAQLAALRLAYHQAMTSYDNQNNELLVYIDTQEKGIDGEGVFYSLHLKNQQATQGSHIPKRILLANLTQSQLKFFNITK